MRSALEVFFSSRGRGDCLGGHLLTFLCESPLGTHLRESVHVDGGTGSRGLVAECLQNCDGVGEVSFNRAGGRTIVEALDLFDFLLFHALRQYRQLVSTESGGKLVKR